MANSQTEGNETRDDMSGIKRKLARRMAVAGLMIVGLLGGLALFDYYSALPDGEKTSDVPQFTEPVPVPKKMATQPVTPVEPDASTDVPPAEPESSAAPVDTVGPIAEPPPPPVVAARPALPDAARRPSPTVAKPAEAAAPAPATRPTMPDQSASAVSPTPLPPPRLSTGYALQVGVFSDTRRAEDLLARLTQEGIPATIEARVHVGPFKSQKEADAARVKLKALGLDSVLLPPRGVKR